MKRLPALLLGALLCTTAWPTYRRLTISLNYKGEAMQATFFSAVQMRAALPAQQQQFFKAARFLDGVRFQNYMLRDPDISPQELEIWKRGFFHWEPLASHDEILILHRGDPIVGEAGRPPGIGREILAMVAIDRLGRPDVDGPPDGGLDALHETLTLEDRLRYAGVRIPRPAGIPWMGRGLPPGVFPHWDPDIASAYFANGRIVIGDVIQANAMFARENLMPLLHSLGNTHGIFSTGRLQNTPEGRVVHIPTLVVWETFNKADETGRIHDGLRTRYYRRTQALPLQIGHSYQWEDPRLEKPYYVQILHKTGADFREGWTELFDQQDGFRFVRDVRIERTAYEYFTEDGRFVSETISPNSPSFYYHPRELNPCIERVLAARQRPAVEVIQPVSISITLNGQTQTLEAPAFRYFTGPNQPLPAIQLVPKIQVSFGGQ